MFHFLSDRPVLDFLATLAERGTTDEEKLGRPSDLAAWSAQAGLTSAAPAVSAGQLAAAIDLREAAYRVLSAFLDGAPPRREDRALLNAVAAQPPPVPRLDATGALRREGGIDAVLAQLARDCLELLAGLDGARLRRCDGPRCTRLFVDRSRGGRRRWCEMSGCGDRAKAAAYRRRRRAPG